MWLFGSRVPALRARGTHPSWSSLAKDGIGFGPVLRFYVEMPMPRLLELQQMAERRHAGQRQMVQEHWQQVRWRYSQEELAPYCNGCWEARQMEQTLGLPPLPPPPSDDEAEQHPPPPPPGDEAEQQVRMLRAELVAMQGNLDIASGSITALEDTVRFNY